MPAEKVHALLDQHEVDYRTHTHPRVVTAQRLAAEEEVSGWNVAKPVLLAVGGDQLAMAVVPASVDVDLSKASRVLGGSAVQLADEDQFVSIFPDCEPGSEPPFGNLYGVPVFLDEQLRAREQMLCRDGSHTEALWLSTNDYVRVVQPEIVDIAARSVRTAQPG